MTSRDPATSSTPAPNVKFRRSAHIVSYWGRAGLRLHNYATGRHQHATPTRLDVLDAYSAWSTVKQAAVACPGCDIATVRRITHDLAAAGFLLRSDVSQESAEGSMNSLGPWNPAVGFFHSVTRNVRFSSLAEAQQAQRRQMPTRPWPGSVYTPEGARSFELPRPVIRDPFSRVLLGRRTWRRFLAKPLRCADLGTLLWITGGIQHWAITDVGDFALKTSPSGGALHPLELYVLIRRVRGLTPGFYHYSGADHRLRRLTRHSRVISVENYLPQQPWFEDAAAITFLVAHYDRYLWKYSYPRAYRGPLIEAGHLAQTFCLKATQLGLAPFVSMALADSAIEREIGADGATRAVLYAAGVGVAPAVSGNEGCVPEGASTSLLRRNVAPFTRRKRIRR